MSQGDTARNNFSSARLELIERIKLRDNVVVIFLGAIGVIFSISLRISENKDILYIIPYLSFGCSLIISQHNSVIGCLARYLVFELEPFLHSINEYAPQWDNSTSLKQYLSKAIQYRSISHVVLIVLPSIFALMLLLEDSLDGSIIQKSLWVIGLVLVAICVDFIIRSHTDRKDFQNEMNEKEEKNDIIINNEKKN
ncbi:MAG: hypothetical protein KKA84_05265 [Bacteroidetes bacterium]|nr:hypothetical protein [Bacteroidota bacterium]